LARTNSGRKTYETKKKENAMQSIQSGPSGNSHSVQFPVLNNNNAEIPALDLCNTLTGEFVNLSSHPNLDEVLQRLEKLSDEILTVDDETTLSEIEDKIDVLQSKMPREELNAQLQDVEAHLRMIRGQVWMRQLHFAKTQEDRESIARKMVQVHARTDTDDSWVDSWAKEIAKSIGSTSQPTEVKSGPLSPRVQLLKPESRAVFGSTDHPVALALGLVETTDPVKLSAVELSKNIVTELKKVSSQGKLDGVLSDLKRLEEGISAIGDRDSLNIVSKNVKTLEAMCEGQHDTADTKQWQRASDILRVINLRILMKSVGFSKSAADKEQILTNIQALLQELISDLDRFPIDEVSRLSEDVKDLSQAIDSMASNEKMALEDLTNSIKELKTELDDFATQRKTDLKRQFNESYLNYLGEGGKNEALVDAVLIAQAALDWPDATGDVIQAVSKSMEKLHQLPKIVSLINGIEAGLQQYSVGANSDRANQLRGAYIKSLLSNEQLEIKTEDPPETEGTFIYLTCMGYPPIFSADQQKEFRAFMEVFGWLYGYEFSIDFVAGRPRSRSTRLSDATSADRLNRLRYRLKFKNSIVGTFTSPFDARFKWGRAEITNDNGGKLELINTTGEEMPDLNINFFEIIVLKWAHAKWGLRESNGTIKGLFDDDPLTYTPPDQLRGAANSVAFTIWPYPTSGDVMYNTKRVATITLGKKGKADFSLLDKTTFLNDLKKGIGGA
jgi:hypothetical protein